MKPSTTPADLQELLLQAKHGDQQAFASLLSRYTPMLEATLQKIRSPHMTDEDMKDLRQEAYLSFYRALLHYDLDQDAVSFGLFAKICVTNGLCSAVRKMKHLNGALVLSLDEWNEQMDERTDPSAHLIEQENFNALYAIIEQTLSPLENQIWRLYIQGKTAPNIAAIIDKNEKTVHNAIYRIRKKLRTALSE